VPQPDSTKAVNNAIESALIFGSLVRHRNKNATAPRWFPPGAAARLPETRFARQLTPSLDEAASREQSQAMTRLTIRIDFDGAEAFGPGKARLLELIEEKGSIRSAAAAMEMSYRHAWLLLAAVEKTFGAPIATTATGGAKGGGAKLTKLGRTILSRYRALEKNAVRAAAVELLALAGATPALTSKKRATHKPHGRFRRRLSAAPRK
jgi:molybdate transport system regulatory protein